MRTDTGQVFRLEDYRPSHYRIPETRLAFDLDPERTTVVSELVIERAADAPVGTPLVLDGDGLDLVSVDINGEALGANAYEATPDRLTIHALPRDRSFRLKVTTR
ncbi:MAG: aminopeptidase N, partial [Mesorhizobium sp.]